MLSQFPKMHHFYDFLSYSLHLKYCNINFILLQMNLFKPIYTFGLQNLR